VTAQCTVHDQSEPVTFPFFHHNRPP
jgi:hypothetical protein